MSSSFAPPSPAIKRWASASLNSVASTALDETSTAAAASETRTIETGKSHIPDTSSDTILIPVGDIPDLRRLEVGEEDWVGSIEGIGWRPWTVRRYSSA
jgi:hypothetical protein